jgi:hypothetical protein
MVRSLLEYDDLIRRKIEYESEALRYDIDVFVRDLEFKLKELEAGKRVYDKRKHLFGREFERKVVEEKYAGATWRLRCGIVYFGSESWVSHSLLREIGLDAEKIIEMVKAGREVEIDKHFGREIEVPHGHLNYLEYYMFTRYVFTIGDYDKESNTVVVGGLDLYDFRPAVELWVELYSLKEPGFYFPKEYKKGVVDLLRRYGFRKYEEL